MEHLSLQRRYRSIYLAGPTFTLLPDDETALQALRAIRQHLTPDGQALIPLWIPDPTPPSDLGVHREATDDQGAKLVYTPLSETYDQSLRTRTTTVRYERHTPNGPAESADRDWIIHWQTQSSAQALCEAAGLSITRIEDESGNPPEPDADYFILTVQRA
jgi:hypothetical protein